MNKHKGFTLLEVLIALVIFGISAVVILEQASRSVQQQAQLEDKTLALWLAENHLAELRLKPQWPNTGTQEKNLSSASREWHILQTVDNTPNPLLRKVTVSVSRENTDTPLVTLQGFIGEH